MVGPCAGPRSLATRWFGVRRLLVEQVFLSPKLRQPQDRASVGTAVPDVTRWERFGFVTYSMLHSSATVLYDVAAIAPCSPGRPF